MGLGFGSVGCARDIGDRGVVVESLGLLIPEVPEAVPLRGGLRVEVPGVVVDDAGMFLVYVLSEGMAGEEGVRTWDGEGSVGGGLVRSWMVCLLLVRMGSSCR